MTVLLNTKPVAEPEDGRLETLLLREGFDPRAVALQLNGVHVGRKRLESVQLRDGDEVWAFLWGGGG